ncbi:hypothetical protein FHS78_002770 [Parvibaculum indicum]|uniref:nuclear transport factor 2 family protein n=1 Tax=Parvibaculum indicum TaxID=562969 RepID=UPI0014247A36|nr:nuclear transport factor 2 family protein [Parvibaculum indicum]NIJ42468.1 hypothetical protein [Parvibaculum indicum]
MSIALPQPIADYFAADKADGEAVALCFTEDGIVTDEARTHEGQTAIAEWKKEASGKYQYTVNPFSIEEKEGKTVVTSKVEGDFPGSPVDLRYSFTLNGNRIARLEIGQ